ncbi:hypothetical protein [Lactiplantibacillus plantarum]|uniref:hypothetical protein n=1 Tax=Lactiplantibacillus plantarum TaxID=1590 RepID=UPI0020019244|nr:hypothetical protein [Lactiplantibacillus plantarum]MCG0895008.1 hypothetical protein [Lactiplantibacillus plantarum]
MYQISITKYSGNISDEGRFEVSSKEAFDELMHRIDAKFSDSKIDWNSYMNHVSTGDCDVYEIDLEQRSDEGIWSMIEHHEFVKNKEIVSFLRNNVK